MANVKMTHNNVSKTEIWEIFGGFISTEDEHRVTRAEPHRSVGVLTAEAGKKCKWSKFNFFHPAFLKIVLFFIFLSS